MPMSSSPLISRLAFSVDPPVVTWVTLISGNWLEISVPATPTM